MSIGITIGDRPANESQNDDFWNLVIDETEPGAPWNIAEISDLQDVQVEIQAVTDDLQTSINNEQSQRQEADLEIVEITNQLSSRITNLINGPSPIDNANAGMQVYLSDFFEVLSSDQIDGLDQRLSFFIGAIGEKVNTISAGIGTGISINLSNPQNPVISQNKPFWENLQNVPSEITDIVSNLASKANTAQLAEKVDTSDSRLSDARTPTAHNHDSAYYTKSQVDAIIETIAEISEEYSTGNSSSGLAGSFQKRTFNQILRNDGSFLTDNGDYTFDLPAGSYRINGFSTYYRTDDFISFLAKASDDSVIVLGSSGKSDASNIISCTSIIDGSFTLAVVTTLQINFKIQTATSNNMGPPVNSGLNNRFSFFRIIKKS